MLKNNTLGRAVYGWGQSLALPLKNGNLDRIFLKPILLSKQPDYALPVSLYCF
jgi:hypothetical protein